MKPYVPLVLTVALSAVAVLFAVKHPNCSFLLVGVVLGYWFFRGLLK